MTRIIHKPPRFRFALLVVTGLLLLTPLLASASFSAPGTDVPERPDRAAPELAYFSLVKPTAPPHRQLAEAYYLFGSKPRGLLLHHGVDIPNPIGTPALAGAAGTVVHAGPDDTQILGLYADFYGNAVVIQADEVSEGQPVYLLYGHLDRVSVRKGQRVAAGQRVGLVGMTGIAMGPHLHFEVRVGENTYDASRNPQLWLGLLDGNGAVVLSVTDDAGNLLTNRAVRFYRDGKILSRMTTYMPGVSPDGPWHENLVFADIPAGDYRIEVLTAKGSVWRSTRVEPGKATHESIQVD